MDCPKCYSKGHVVADRTITAAQTHGARVVEIMQPMCGPSKYAVAISFFDGSIICIGVLGWVLSELNRLGISYKEVN